MTARRVVELRSDTFTLPTPAMYEALREAELGDDVYEEDPTVNRLEALAAATTGKEAALLVASGTQANLVAVLCHCAPGSEAIVGATSDLYNSEVGGISALGGIFPRPVDDRNGSPSAEEVARVIRLPDIHAGPTRLLCLENTHQRAGGVPIEPERLRQLADCAHERDLALHIDGARLFNAAVALGVPASELAAPADSVSFCLTKGLCSPVGSLLCASVELIERARRLRKMLGGGMRQAGWIAAAGIVALEQMIERLIEDHENARLLTELLSDLPGVVVDSGRVRTNIVYVELIDLHAAEFVARLQTGRVRAFAMGERTVRFVTSRLVDSKDVHYAAQVCARALSGELQAGAPAAFGPHM